MEMEGCKTIATTTEMHTGGEPLRILETPTLQLTGSTILDKREEARASHDQLRRLLIYEPRGHFDMYGAVFVEPDIPEADVAVLFTHNQGYSTMCGHAVIALGRYVIDHKLIPSHRIVGPEIKVNIQCPCGLVQAFVQYEKGKTGAVKFHSVPSFAFALDYNVEVGGHGSIAVDIGYGGAFYALVAAQKLGLDINTSSTKDIQTAAAAVSDAVRGTVKLRHPDSEHLAFLYGTILTDGNDTYTPHHPTTNTCVFADREVDRSPTGSGVSARVAVQHARGLIAPRQTREFRSGVNGSVFTGAVVREVPCEAGVGGTAVVVEVGGRAHYCGKATYVLEDDDPFQNGFLPR